MKYQIALYALPSGSLCPKLYYNVEEVAARLEMSTQQVSDAIRDKRSCGNFIVLRSNTGFPGKINLSDYKLRSVFAVYDNYGMLMGTAKSHNELKRLYAVQPDNARVVQHIVGTTPRARARPATEAKRYFLTRGIVISGFNNHKRIRLCYANPDAFIKAYPNFTYGSLETALSIGFFTKDNIKYSLSFSK